MMNKQNSVIVWCFLLTLAFANDAFARSSETLHDFRLIGSSPVERKVEFRPLAFAGLELTDNIKSGNFVCFSWNYPETVEAFSEWDRLRISFQAHVVGEDGSEYVTHALFAGVIGNIPAPRYGGVVEGISGPRSDLKGVTLTTELDKAYTLLGKEIPEFDPEKWENGEYRRSFVLKYGTTLSETPVSELVKNEVMNWNVYETKIGLVASPWNEDQVRKLAVINPQDTFLQKLVGVGKFRIRLSPIATASGAVLDVIGAIGAKSRNFGHKSVQSREEQGYNMLCWTRLYKDCLERNFGRTNN